MKLVTYNIQYSLGKDGNYNIERIADAVRGADIIALQEVTRNFSQLPDKDQPARIAQLLTDYYWVYGPAVDLDASERDANGKLLNKRAQFGNMLLAKWPILSSRLLLLPRMRTYDKTNFQCGMLEGVVDLPAGSLRVYSTHLNHNNPAERIAQIEFILSKLHNGPYEGGTISGTEASNISFELREVLLPEEFVVLGDCNLKPDSAEYTRIVGEMDYYYGSRITAQHLVDTWVQSGHAKDSGVTWYDKPENSTTKSRLDYGFVSAGLASKVKQAWIDNEAIGSDHQPTWFELDL
jgi:endonuclease/exonuclease/phosphatase family metal-dependent hydrolase